MKVNVTEAEMRFRATLNLDFKSLKPGQLVCASCSAQLHKIQPGKVFSHPMMGTLQCKKCHDFYGDREFSRDIDGTDKYCRLCGDGGHLYICENDCPYGFCKDCIIRNVHECLDDAESEDWKCFLCNDKPFWQLRAICASVTSAISKKPRRQTKKSSRREASSDSNSDIINSESSSSNSESMKFDVKRKNRGTNYTAKKRAETMKTLRRLQRVCDDADDEPVTVRPSFMSFLRSKDGPTQTTDTDDSDREVMQGTKSDKRSLNQERKSMSDEESKSKKPNNKVRKKHVIENSSDSEKSDQLQHVMKTSTNVCKRRNKFKKKSKSEEADTDGEVKKNSKKSQKSDKQSRNHLKNAVAHDTDKSRKWNITSISELGSCMGQSSDSEKSNELLIEPRKTGKNVWKRKNIFQQMSESEADSNGDVKKNHSKPQKSYRQTRNHNDEAEKSRKLNNTLSSKPKDHMEHDPDSAQSDQVMEESIIITSKDVQKRKYKVLQKSDLEEVEKVKKKGSSPSRTKFQRIKSSSNSDEKTSFWERSKKSESLEQSSKPEASNSNAELSSGKEFENPEMSFYRNKQRTIRPLCKLDEGYVQVDRRVSMELPPIRVDRPKKNFKKKQAATINVLVTTVLDKLKILGKGLAAGAEKISNEYSDQKFVDINSITEVRQECKKIIRNAIARLNEFDLEIMNQDDDWYYECNISADPNDISDDSQQSKSLGKNDQQMKIKVTDNKSALEDSDEDENPSHNSTKLKRKSTVPNKNAVLNNASSGDGENENLISKNNEGIADNDGNFDASMSECDSETIFSGDETRMSFKNKEKEKEDNSRAELLMDKKKVSSLDNSKVDSDSSLDLFAESSMEANNAALENLGTQKQIETTEARTSDSEKVNESVNSSNGERLKTPSAKHKHEIDGFSDAETVYLSPHLLQASKKHSKGKKGDDTTMSSSEQTTPELESAGNREDPNDTDDTLDKNKEAQGKCKSRNSLKVLDTSTEAQDSDDSGKNVSNESLLPDSSHTEISPKDNKAEQTRSVDEKGRFSENSIKSDKSAGDRDNRTVSSDSEEYAKELLSESDSEDSHDIILSKSKLSHSDTSHIGGNAKDEEIENDDKRNSNSQKSEKSANDEKDKNLSSDSDQQIRRTLMKCDSDTSIDETSHPDPIIDQSKVTSKSEDSDHSKLNENSDSEGGAKKRLLESDIDSSASTSMKSEQSGNKRIPSKNAKSRLNEKNRISESDSSNSKAKKALLMSSESESWDSEENCKLKLFTSNSSDFDRDSENKIVSMKRKSNTTDSDTSVTFKPKRKKFKLDKNKHYKNDKKLRMICEVAVQRLEQNVLDQFSRVLKKSSRRQENRAFESLVDLDNLDKRRLRSDRSNGSSSDDSSSKSSSKELRKKKKSKIEQEKGETLMDHLEKVKNGEVNENEDNDFDNNDGRTSREPVQREITEEEFISGANRAAKELLMNSSDSDNDVITMPEGAEDEEAGGSKKKTKAKENEKIDEEPKVNGDKGSDEEKSDEENSHKETLSIQEGESEDEEKMHRKKVRSSWRSDKILTLSLTDSDSSDEQKKWNRSQDKKKMKSEEKKSDSDSDAHDDKKSKRMKKTKRRVLGSDSNSIEWSDEDSDEIFTKMNKKKQKSDSEDSDFMIIETKKKKRNARKSSNESDSSLGEKRSKPKRKRIKTVDSDSDSDGGLENSQGTSGKSGRKNIRKVLKDKQVADDTKQAAKEEEERLKRIAERQKLYNEMYEMRLAGEKKVDKLVLDFDEETKEELVSVHENLVKRLKPHQAQGIKFMWDACFESLERAKSTKGSGCIIAHCMGLGKTFQVVTLAHTLLCNEETGIKTVMVVCPLSTVLNWVNEFNTWLKDINDGEDINIFEMTKTKKHFERKYQLEEWQRCGGVMIMGYEMFRNLSNPGGKKMRKSMQESILKCLVDPGADLIVCDEGHLLKNEDTALSKAMKRVKTLRRVVLTGTPLQNNLVEYHCMVQFVKPNLLGTKKEFLNRFVNPITNGQFDDSTAYDVKLMKKRAHVLHKMLEGSVQRFDYSVLTPFLPPKQEYVISLKLSDVQNKLYQHYLDHFARQHRGAGGSLFADFQALQRIWTHPIVLRMNAEKVERLNEKKRLDASDSEGSLKDFIDDGSDEDTSTSGSDIRSVHESEDENAPKTKRATRANPGEEEPAPVEEEIPGASSEWWSQYVQPEHYEDLRVSSKLTLLFAILKECEQIGDKVLVFSQSLYSLSLIEEFLRKIDDETQNNTNSEFVDGHSGSWSLGLDYFRLDGQTSAENRSIWCKVFNKPSNTRARLFLISTRAGGLGINLTAANRVIIFDASWNPSHDVQSIFRIYRFGQKKPCYVYRFLAHGTMEEKIYNRQVTKLSLSCRVVDEQQIERHYSNHDLAELYRFEPSDNAEVSTHNLPKDRLLAEILLKYSNRLRNYHEHDSLLENKAEEELNEEERKQAWLEYEQEEKGKPAIQMNYQLQAQNQLWHNMLMGMANQNTDANIPNMRIDYANLEALIRKDYPLMTPEQQKMMTTKTVMDMYAYMENQIVKANPRNAMRQQNFGYLPMSNPNAAAFSRNTSVLAQQQYVAQQQQMHQMLVQREQQMNYAKQHGNMRGLAPNPLATVPGQTVNVNPRPVDDDIIEIPSTSAPTTSTGAQPTPATGNRKSQEE